MNKKLTAKVQVLKPVTKENSEHFSGCFVIEPDSKDLVLKKGQLYVVFEVNSETPFDVNLVSKVLHDVLYNSYYTSDSISAIQSLEKAIVEVKDNVSNLPNQSIHSEQASIEFSFLGAVLWGNVFYIVKYGKAKSYLMRDGEIKEVDTAGEGGFSSASGVVKDDDVVILCTYGFGTKYPPEKLLKLSLSEQELDSGDSCILLKFIVDTTFTQDEIVDFGPVTQPKISLAKKIKNLFSKVKRPNFDSIKIKLKQRSKNSAEQLTSLAPKISIRKFKPKIKIKLAYLIPAVVVILGVSIVFTMIKNKKPQQQNTSTEEQEQSVQGVSIQKPVEDKDVFYDVKITDSNANPSEVLVFSNVVVCSDKNAGKVYLSDIVTPKFTPLDNTFLGVRYLVNSAGKLAFVDNEGYKVFDLATKLVTENYSGMVSGLNDTYLTNIYSIEGDKIVKYVRSSGSLTKSDWAKNLDFKDARSLSVAYSIFIVTSSGDLVSYTSGTKTNFKVTGVDSYEFKNVVTSVAFNNIYVSDVKNNRMILLDKNGKFVKDIKGTWEKIDSFSISPDEKILFVLSGSKVYKLSL